MSGLVLIAPAFAQQPPPAIMRCKRSARLAARGIRRRHLEALVAASPGSAGARSNAKHCEVENDRRARAVVLDGPVADLDRPGARARFGEILALAHGRRATLQRQLVELAAVMPVLLISGTRDPIVADTGAAETLVFEGVGHFPQLDRPAEVAAAIERMRARTAVARAA